MEKVAMVCIGKEFWGSFAKWITEQMLENGEKMIGKKDLELFKVVDTVEEAMKIIRRSKEREFF